VDHRETMMTAVNCFSSLFLYGYFYFCDIAKCPQSIFGEASAKEAGV